MSKADPNELIEVEFTGDHVRELRDSEGNISRMLGKGDRYMMKREQADADGEVTATVQARHTVPGKRPDAE